MLKKKEINGLLFDKFKGKNQFRLFPYDQNFSGSFEVYVKTFEIRFKSKHFLNLELTEKDKKILEYAFQNRIGLGLADGMGDYIRVRGRGTGQDVDNYFVDSKTLLSLYDKLYPSIVKKIWLYTKNFINKIKFY